MGVAAAGQERKQQSGGKQSVSRHVEHWPRQVGDLRIVSGDGTKMADNHDGVEWCNWRQSASSGTGCRISVKGQPPCDTGRVCAAALAGGLARIASRHCARRTRARVDGVLE